MLTQDEGVDQLSQCCHFCSLSKVGVVTTMFICSYVCPGINIVNKKFYFMFDFATQKKVLDPILKNSRNHLCADCDTISPTWASLDFGVFLCGNCSGAHRALGPTITRVRSANLDKWEEKWVENMLIGNEELNKYWESDPRVSDRKPKMGATLNEIGRYVFEKYVKKRFVLDSAAIDPLTSYKNGTYQISKEGSPAPAQPQPSKPPAVEARSEPKVEAKPARQVQEISLLDFDMDGSHQPKSLPQQQTVIQHQQLQNGPLLQPSQQPQHVHYDDDQFTDYTQPGSVARQQVISFDALMSQHKQPPQQSQYHSYNGIKSQNMALHHPYNPNIAQHNLVYNAHFQQAPPQQQQQQYQQQFHGYSVNPTYPSTHTYSPVGHSYPNMYMQQYNTGYNAQVGVGNYWK